MPRHFVMPSLILLGFVLLSDQGSPVESQAALSIGQFELVSERVIEKKLHEFVYKATLTNIGASLKGAVAVASGSAKVAMVDGELAFPATRRGGSSRSLDTFTLRRRDTGSFKWSDIRWTIMPTVNVAPVADAGADQTVELGDVATLTASASTDTDGDQLTFAWRFISKPAGSMALLSEPASIAPRFTADVAGSYSLQLVVHDGDTFSEPDTVVVSTRNSQPVANAGSDRSATVGQTVTLDGSASSDADGDPLSFSWTLVTKPFSSASTLTNATSVGPTFLVDTPGEYVVRLVVNDGNSSSMPSTVTVSTENTLPIARAGSDQTVRVGDTVRLDGSASTDVDGDQISFVWSLIAQPADSSAHLAAGDTVVSTFTVDKPGIYVAQLIVSDEHGSGTPDTVTVTTGNSPPIAVAGADQSVIAGSTVLLDGTQSSDPDGDPISFEWAITSKPTDSSAVLSNSTSPGPSFVVDRPGAYVVQLLVSDSVVASAPDSLVVTTTNSAPVASAGQDQTNVVLGATVALDGSQSIDVDAHPLSYSWSLIARPAGSLTTLSDAASATPAFVPDVAGDYIAQLIVNDGFVDSVPDTALIRVVGFVLSSVAIEAIDPAASELGPDVSIFRITRTGDTTVPLTVVYSVSGTAENGTDYARLTGTVVIPASATYAELTLVPAIDTLAEGPETVMLSLEDGVDYDVMQPTSATITIADSGVPIGSFSFRLPFSALTAFAGSRVRVLVEIQREAGFAGAIDVGLLAPPPGISASAVRIAPEYSNGALSITVESERAPGDVVFEIAAIAGSVTRTARLTLSIKPPEPRAQDLIRAALAGGIIDRPTSLLYRAYALTGDPRLPEAYRGSGSEREGTGLFQEILAALDNASPELRAALEPFTLRPTDPRSWYARILSAVQPAANLSVLRRDASLTANMLVSEGYPDTCAAASTDGWISRRSGTYPFRVWAWCALEDSELSAQADIDQTIRVLDTAWPFETALMTTSPNADDAPIDPTTGMVDTDLDIYVLFPNTLLMRYAESAVVGNEPATGWMQPLPEFGSGYIGVMSNAMRSDAALIVGAHELFHALQVRYSPQLFKADDTWWYTEASAEWAATYVDRYATNWPGGRQAYANLYLPDFAFGFRFRGPTKSLNDFSANPYQAFIWPYFMEQSTRELFPARDVWQATAQATTFEEADKVLDRLFPFTEKFRHFAVRNINATLSPGNPLPHSERFVALDSEFTDEAEPLLEPVSLVSGPDRALVASVAPLAAKYFKVVVADPSLLRVVFEFDQIVASTDFDVDAFVKIAGRDWKRQNLDGARQLSFCMNNPAERLEQLLLIVSNHRVAVPEPAADPPSVKVNVKLSAPPCGLVGSVSFTGRSEQKALGKTINLQTGEITTNDLEFELVASTADRQEFRPSTGRVTWRSSWSSWSLDTDTTCYGEGTGTYLVSKSDGQIVIDRTTIDGEANGRNAGFPTILVTCSNGQSSFVPAPYAVTWLYTNGARPVPEQSTFPRTYSDSASLIVQIPGEPSTDSTLTWRWNLTNLTPP